MKEDDIELDGELRALWRGLRELHHRQREHTKKKFNRVNPFAEDLFEWEEKGQFFGGKNVRIYDSATVIGDVRIGDNVWIGPFCIVDGSGGLTIGDWCDISSGVKIFTHDTVRRALSGGRAQPEKEPVKIGDCCFIGTDTVILRGVEIGEHSLVAANSLVNRSCPPYSILAGVPAKLIGRVAVNGEKVDLIMEKGKRK